MISYSIEILIQLCFSISDSKYYLIWSCLQSEIGVSPKKFLQCKLAAFFNKDLQNADIISTSNSDMKRGTLSVIKSIYLSVIFYKSFKDIRIFVISCCYV